MHPRHVVMATGVSGIPNLPEIAGLKNFAGTVLHSSQYDDGEAWKGKRAIVIGTGNSGHDIAQDLQSSGATVTLVQRSSTLVTNIAPTAQPAYAASNEATPEDSDLIASGAIGLIQFSDIESFAADGVRMKDGELIGADLIVLATGYQPQEYLVRKLFGEDIANRVGPIWGFGDGQELRNMYTRTGQPGLWFIAGSLAQCRINSKYLALQIKAIEAGLLPRPALAATMHDAAVA